MGCYVNFIRENIFAMVHIASLDVGTTNVRCFILNEKCDIEGSATELVHLLNPKPGYFEIEPEPLWCKIVKVITGAIRDAQLTPAQISCLSISSQRCTFLTWNHRTNVYYSNFITWKDLRANILVDRWNNGFTRKVINSVAYGLYLATRSKRFLAGSIIQMMNGQVTLRLLHEMQNNPPLQQALKDKTARIEFLDSWILYKLRSGNGLLTDVEHISDITSCTATGIFDPFILDWSPIIAFLFGIDTTLLPKIVDNSYKEFGTVHPLALQQHGVDWECVQIPIIASTSDQTAAIWGSNCFDVGDSKITLGTGAFLDLITGPDCHASLLGMYPLVAWQFRCSSIKAQTTFCFEGAVHDVGSIIEWTKSCGLVNDIAETAAVAESVDDTGGVYFVPAFSGLGPPINDFTAGSGFLGVAPSTTRAHLVRAMLESIVFRVAQLCETAEKETNLKLRVLKVDGGVSRNNFICQFLADTTGIPVETPQNSESSIMGAFFMAGINLGLWKDTEQIRKFRKVGRVFEPCEQRTQEIRKRMETWNKVIQRFKNWY